MSFKFVSAMAGHPISPGRMHQVPWELQRLGRRGHDMITAVGQWCAPKRCTHDQLQPVLLLEEVDGDGSDDDQGR